MTIRNGGRIRHGRAGVQCPALDARDDMEILVGLALALVLLYFWLLGHWFARVVMFLALAVAFGGLGALYAGADGPPGHNHGWVGMLIGVALAWPVSSIPIYWLRSKAP